MPDQEFQTTGNQEQRKPVKSVKKRAGSFFIKLLFGLFLVAAILVYWFYYNVYSSGERKGTLIKISHKGNVFKTNEGEMWLSCRQVMNISSEKFFFSITSDSLTQVLMKLQDECVQLSYKQYRKTLPWRGDSEYIVTGVEAIPSSKVPQLSQ